VLVIPLLVVHVIRPDDTTVTPYVTHDTSVTVIAFIPTTRLLLALLVYVVCCVLNSV